jgi:REP element-mobilizing transposase RayT
VGRRLRFIADRALVEVTARTLQGRFLLKPSPGLREIFIGILARAAERYAVEVHAFVVVSSHLHCLLTPHDARELASFMCYLLTNLSKEAGRLHRWPGPLFQRRYQAIPVSTEDEAQVGRLRYILSHGCKEGLVAKVCEWPGAHCAEALASGKPCEGVWFDRRQGWLAWLRGKQHTPDAFATRHSLHLAPLPCWRHLSPQTIQQRVAEMIATIEEETAVRQRAQGGKPLGVAGILRQDPHHGPPTLDRSPAVLFHAASKQMRAEMRAAYISFVAAFRIAAERLRAGCRDVVFPRGCFPPPLPFCRTGFG